MQDRMLLENIWKYTGDVYSTTKNKLVLDFRQTGSLTLSN